MPDCNFRLFSDHVKLSRSHLACSLNGSFSPSSQALYKFANAFFVVRQHWSWCNRSFINLKHSEYLTATVFLKVISLSYVIFNMFKNNYFYPLKIKRCHCDNYVLVSVENLRLAMVRVCPGVPLVGSPGNDLSLNLY